MSETLLNEDGQGGAVAAIDDKELQDNTASVETGEPDTSGMSETEAAMAKAQHKLTSQGDQESSAASGEQATASDEESSESTRSEEGEEAGKTEDDATSAASEGESDSTVSAPENWPQEQREKFDNLPDDNARAMVLDISKDLQGGYTQAMQQVAELKKGHELLHQTIDSHGVNDQTVVDLMGTAARFEQDPKTVLAELAKEKDVEIFFERPLPEGEIPEFETQAELAAWLDKRSQERAEKVLADREAKKAEEDARTQAADALRNELTEFASKTPDFVQHKDSVIEQLATTPGLSVADAYTLKVEVPAMRAELETARQAVKDLAVLKAKQEAQEKRVTQLPAGSGASSEAEGDPDLSDTEKALKRAQRKLAAAS